MEPTQRATLHRLAGRFVDARSLHARLAPQIIDPRAADLLHRLLQAHDAVTADLSRPLRSAPRPVPSLHATVQARLQWLRVCASVDPELAGLQRIVRVEGAVLQQLDDAIDGPGDWNQPLHRDLGQLVRLHAHLESVLGDMQGPSLALARHSAAPASLPGSGSARH